MIHLASHARPALRLAAPEDRDAIGRHRHDVYAHELGQHPPNAAGRLRDALDDANVYLVAEIDGRIGGFVSITPPEAGPTRWTSTSPASASPSPSTPVFTKSAS